MARGKERMLGTSEASRWHDILPDGGGCQRLPRAPQGPPEQLPPPAPWSACSGAAPKKAVNRFLRPPHFGVRPAIELDRVKYFPVYLYATAALGQLWKLTPVENTNLIIVELVFFLELTCVVGGSRLRTVRLAAERGEACFSVIELSIA